MTPKTHSIVWLVVVIVAVALASMASHSESSVPRHEWRVESLVPDLQPPLPPMPRVVSIEGVTLGDGFETLEGKFGKPESEIIHGCVLYDEQCFELPEGTLTARAVSNEIYRLDGHRLEVDGKVLAVPGTERSGIVKVLGHPTHDTSGNGTVYYDWYYWDLGLGLRFRGQTFESAWLCSKFHDPNGYLECCPPSEQFTDPEDSSRCER